MTKLIQEASALAWSARKEVLVNLIRNAIEAMERIRKARSFDLHAVRA